jgi:hypothetical protein
MRMGELRLVLETPEMHASGPMQTYISREVARPCKQWIYEVLCSRREADRVKLRTPSFVLLPDVNCFQKRPRDLCWQEAGERRWRMRRPQASFHWLAVVTDVGLRTLRDLRGEHIPMLTALYTQSCLKIKAETGVDPEQIMVFIHYPPSVYQLHVHFKYPVSQSASHDTFRIHPLAVIINNLQIDREYYSKSLLQLPVYTNTELFTALGREEEWRECLLLTNGEDVTDVDVTDVDITSPDITNPDITNQDITNPDSTNQDITTPDVTNTAVTISYVTAVAASDIAQTVPNIHTNQDACSSASTSRGSRQSTPDPMTDPPTSSATPDTST